MPAIAYNHSTREKMIGRTSDRHTSRPQEFGDASRNLVHAVETGGGEGGEFF